MTAQEILENIPEAAKVLGSWATGIFTFYVGYRGYQSKQRKSKSALLKEYKDMYIKASMESLELAQSDSTRRRILYEMKQFCPDCYQTALENLKLNEKDI